MFTLSIKDFAINTEHVFSRAVPFEMAGITSFSEAALNAFGFVQPAKDIALDQGDQLYNYRLTVDMYGGAAEIALTSTQLLTAFRNGRNKRDLRLIGEHLIAIETLLQEGRVGHRRLAFVAHAVFKKPEEFDLHMGRVADKTRGYSAGGVVLHTAQNPFEGTLRFSTDKSLAYENALFVSCEVVSREVFSTDLLNRISGKFVEVAKDLGLEFEVDQ